MLCTTWNSLAQSYQPWLHVEAAMSTFANAIEQTGFVSRDQSLKVRTQLTPSQVVTFVASFSHIYDLLNDLGYLGRSTLRCAQMIKVVPLHRAIPSSSFDTLAWCKETEPATCENNESSSTGKFAETHKIQRVNTSSAITTSTSEAPPACDLCRARKVKVSVTIN